MDHLPPDLHPDGEVGPELADAPFRDIKGHPLRRGLYRLTETIASPAKDKRTDWHWTLPTVKAGTLAIVDIATNQDGEIVRIEMSKPGRKPGTSISLTYHKVHMQEKSYKLAMLFFSKAEPVPMTSSYEVIHDAPSHVPFAILDALVRSGKTSLAEIASLMKDAS